MGPFVTRTMVALSLAAGSFAIANPANATVWKNGADSSFCLNVYEGRVTSGTPLVILKCASAVATKHWGRKPYFVPFYQLWTMALPEPVDSAARCAGTAGGKIDNGTSIILWSCNRTDQSHDQGWMSLYRGSHWDFNGIEHRCYSFINQKAAEPPQVLRALGVSGGIMTHGRAVILWDYGEFDHPDQIWCEY